MNLMRGKIGLAQVVGLSMLVLAGCGDDSDKRDAGDGGFDGRQDGPALEVGEGGIGDATAETAGDGGATETGADTTADSVGDVRTDARLDVPITGDGALDGSLTDAAIDAPASDATGDVGDVGPLALLATLGGDQEIPSVATTATGTASFVLDPGRTMLSYRLVHNLTDANAVQIRLGSGNEAGPMLFTLSPVSLDMTGSVTLTPTQVAELLAGRMYVNVYSPLHPAGGIRGQILLPGEILFVATLNGEQETPPTETTATGFASVILSASKDSIKYHLQTSLIPTGAHIHTGIGGLPGPITIPFTPVAPLIRGTAAMTPAQVVDLAEGRMFVNVHTTAYPSGEIRGQLLLPGERLATAILSGANETPPVMTTATGAAAFILSYAQDTMKYEGTFTGLSGPATSATLIGGIAGDAGFTNYSLTLLPGGMSIKGVQAVLPGDVAALMTSPPGLFVDVNTAANPNGEIGGPLMLLEM